MALPRPTDESPKFDKADILTLRPEHLRLGMYVDLNCSWFKHPFPRRSFKLTSQSQIATIRGLGLATVLVYPQDSDAETETVTDECPQEPSPAETEGSVTTTDEAADHETPLPESEPPSHGDYHQAVELASEAYRQMLSRSSQMMKDLGGGSQEGLRSAQLMIGGLSTLLTNTEAAGTIASAFDPEDIGDANVLHALN
ncbi:MAG TPA: DUF3391 domain-containing protein, partial [Nitrospira sp.]|nr:DUF3391 domain-containing protein [Nitrospira sp.]